RRRPGAASTGGPCLGHAGMPFLDMHPERAEAIFRSQRRLVIHRSILCTKEASSECCSRQPWNGLLTAMPSTYLTNGLTRHELRHVALAGMTDASWPTALAAFK